MTYYFGFEPTDKLIGQIDEANHLVETGTDEKYYPRRNAISQQIGVEIIDNLLVNLINVIPDEERKAKLTKIVGTVESATEKMLNILLGKDSNEEVMPNITYLNEETLFEDNEGNRRIGFELDESTAQTIIKGFDAVKADTSNTKELTKGLFAMNHAVVDHFITRFSETLPLGLIKRKSVPIAKAGINKALEIAINKIIPQLPEDSINRLVDFYRPYIVEKQ